MDIECAHCGNKQLIQIPGQWTPVAINEQNTIVQGPAVPVVMMGCSKCGFVQLFSPQAVKPQPFPEKPAKAETPAEAKA